MCLFLKQMVVDIQINTFFIFVAADPEICVIHLLYLQLYLL